MIYCDGSVAIKFRGNWYGPYHSVYVATAELEHRGATLIPKELPDGKHLCGYRDSDGFWCSGTVLIRAYWGRVLPTDILLLTPKHMATQV